MQEIIIEPCSLWEYLKGLDKRGQLDNIMYEIAKSEEYGTVVYVSKDEKGRYRISVEADDIEVYSDFIYNKEDAEETCNKIYNNYLTDRVVEVLMEIGEDSALAQMDEIEIREEELTNIVTVFIMDVLGGDTYYDGTIFDEIIDDCKEHFLEYMARKHGFTIYRPMILEDEDGKDFFEEYPYECMEFDDKNNPIYKS